MNICCLWGPTGFVPMCMFLFYFFGLLTAIISNCSDSLKNMGLFTAIISNCSKKRNVANCAVTEFFLENLVKYIIYIIWYIVFLNSVRFFKIKFY
jgi:hypothetical protein